MLVIWLRRLKQSPRGVLYQPCNFTKKEPLAQVFSCEFCKISKNTFFYRIPPVAASEAYMLLKDR